MLPLERILNLYAQYGANNYIGEGITQIEHALQCAECAENDTRLNKDDDYIKNCMIVAALLHDIGHLLGIESGAIEMKKKIDADDADDACDVGDNTSSLNSLSSLGILEHEIVGSNFLKECGMPFLISELVGYHVKAKRYLCTIDMGYYNNLSDASKETMKIQGGLMSSQEMNEFKTSIMFELKIYIREYDDLGKRNCEINNIDINNDNAILIDNYNANANASRNLIGIEKYKKNIAIALLQGKVERN